MTSKPQIAAAEERVLDAADILPDLVDGLLPLVEARRRTFAAEQALEADLAEVDLLADQLEEKSRRVRDRRKDADKAAKDLDGLAGELGGNAFSAVEVGDLAEEELFGARLRARDEVEAIEAEISELSQAKGFGAIVKAKAQQAALFAKSTATKARYRSLEKDIGRALLEARAEEQMRCAQTEVVLSKIAAARTGVGQLDQLLNAANAELMALGQGAETDLSLESVRGPKDLEPARERMREGIHAAVRERVAAGKRILQRLDVAVSIGELPHDSELWVALKELRALHAPAAADDDDDGYDD